MGQFLTRTYRTTGFTPPTQALRDVESCTTYQNFKRRALPHKPCIACHLSDLWRYHRPERAGSAASGPESSKKMPLPSMPWLVGSSHKIGWRPSTLARLARAEKSGVMSQD